MKRSAILFHVISLTVSRARSPTLALRSWLRRRFLTALARPIAGDPIWDFVERTANWATPLALLYLRGLPKNLKEFFT